MVAMPHIIPGWSCCVKICHARAGGSGQDLNLLAQTYPFRAISQMCLPPLDVGPKYIPSIKKASSLCKVGIGAVVPSGSGTLKCKRAILLDGRVMGAIDFGRA